MQANPSNGTSVISGFVNLVIVAAALVIMYYSFKFFYGDITDKGITILSNKIYANQGTKTITNQSKIYEGGEYTVNLWLYLSGWKKNYGTRKHVFQLGGSNFSTLLIALGAFKNSLMVRTHTASVSGGKSREHYADYPHRDASGYDVNGLKKKSGSAISTAEANAEYRESKSWDKRGVNAQLAAGGDRGAGSSSSSSKNYRDGSGNYNTWSASSSSGRGRGGSSASGSSASGSSASGSGGSWRETTTQDISLTTRDVSDLFKPLSFDDGLTHSMPACDIDEIDLQRWIQLTVILNGRTCDIYMDGKLVRSCVLKSFFKVDPTGQTVKLVDRGGFDGYISNVSTHNYAMGPDAVYRSYMAGPTGGSTDPWAYLMSWFQPKPTPPNQATVGEKTCYDLCGNTVPT
jgi:hypothetical protein